MTQTWKKAAAINLLATLAVPGAVAATRTCARGRCPCFVAGTPVATASGPIDIERVAVGQRVLPASPACAAMDAGAAGLTAYHLQIRGADGDVFAIRLLRPHDWPHAPGARPGEWVHVELDEMNVRGLALVTAWDPHPAIDVDPRRGCLVTGTVSHTATTLSVLRLVDDDAPIIATPWHRVYSHTRDDWVAIEDLAPGELLRTADGTIAVESVVELGDQHEPVFNLEVAGSHRYFVHGRRVLTHNTYGVSRGGPSFGPRSLGATEVRILQSGGNQIRSGTARALNEAAGRNLPRREWGHALEALKKDMGLPNNHHGKITSTGDYLDSAGTFIANLFEYLP